MVELIESISRGSTEDYDPLERVYLADYYDVFSYFGVKYLEWFLGNHHSRDIWNFFVCISGFPTFVRKQFCLQNCV